MLLLAVAETPQVHVHQRQVFRLVGSEIVSWN